MRHRAEVDGAVRSGWEVRDAECVEEVSTN
jgi:hypothetical protein